MTEPWDLNKSFIGLMSNAAAQDNAAANSALMTAFKSQISRQDAATADGRTINRMGIANSQAEDRAVSAYGRTIARDAITHGRNVADREDKQAYGRENIERGYKRQDDTYDRGRRHKKEDTQDTREYNESLKQGNREQSLADRDEQRAYDAMLRKEERGLLLTDREAQHKRQLELKKAAQKPSLRFGQNKAKPEASNVRRDGPVGGPTRINNTAARLKQKMLDRGMPDHIADGFIMNFQSESGMDAGRQEVSPLVKGSRGGRGLYQLTGPRRREYEAYAASRGVPFENEDAQLDFLMMELDGSEAGAARSIFATKTAGEAGAAIVNKFLRPSPEHAARRSQAYLNGKGQANFSSGPDNVRNRANNAGAYNESSQHQQPDAAMYNPDPYSQYMGGNPQDLYGAEMQAAQPADIGDTAVAQVADAIDPAIAESTNVASTRMDDEGVDPQTRDYLLSQNMEAIDRIPLNASAYDQLPEELKKQLVPDIYNNGHYYQIKGISAEGITAVHAETGVPQDNAEGHTIMIDGKPVKLDLPNG